MKRAVLLLLTALGLPACTQSTSVFRLTNWVTQGPMMGGHGRRHGMGGPMMGGGGMMGGGMMGRDMAVIHGLFAARERIHREVEDIPGGVRTVTVSEDPEVADLIRTHVWQMKERMEEGRPIHQMDPLFRELFAHHAQVHLDVEAVPGGARVTETSEDPEVVKLIRQHARHAVNEFLAQGMSRMMQPTPLPEGYRGTP